MNESSKRGSLAKVERAEKHINELTDLLVPFVAQNPYEVFGEEDLDTGEIVGRFRENVPTPREEISLIAGDAIHNLRSALDILYGELVAANNKRPSSKDAFPITADADEFKALLPKVEKRLGLAATTTLKELKPYQGGHDAYWRLHKLDIIDKHRLLLTAVATMQEIIITKGGMGLRMTPTDIRHFRDGDEVFRVDEEPDQQMTFRCEISLHEPPVAEAERGEQVVALLNYFAGGVRETIRRFETAGHLPALSLEGIVPP